MSFDHVWDDLADKVAAVEEHPLTPPTVEAEGSSRDDLVRLTMRGGKFTEARVQPQVSKVSNVELGQLLVDAANAALVAHNEALVQAMGASNTDFGALNKDLEKLRSEAQHQMNRYLQSMESMLAQAAGQKERYDV